MTNKRRDLAKHANVFGSHKEARKHEIEVQANKSHYQRMVDFMELQRRVWGEETVDIRESGVARIRRDQE